MLYRLRFVPLLRRSIRANATPGLRGRRYLGTRRDRRDSDEESGSESDLLELFVISESESEYSGEGDRSCDECAEGAEELERQERGPSTLADVDYADDDSHLDLPRSLSPPARFTGSALAAMAPSASSSVLSFSSASAFARRLFPSSAAIAPSISTVLKRRFSTGVNQLSDADLDEEDKRRQQQQQQLSLGDVPLPSGKMRVPLRRVMRELGAMYKAEQEAIEKEEAAEAALLAASRKRKKSSSSKPSVQPLSYSPASPSSSSISQRERLRLMALMKQQEEEELREAERRRQQLLQMQREWEARQSDSEMSAMGSETEVENDDAYLDALFAEMAKLQGRKERGPVDKYGRALGEDGKPLVEVVEEFVSDSDEVLEEHEKPEHIERMKKVAIEQAERAAKGKKLSRIEREVAAREALPRYMDFTETFRHEDSEGEERQAGAEAEYSDDDSGQGTDLESMPPEVLAAEIDRHIRLGMIKGPSQEEIASYLRRVQEKHGVFTSTEQLEEILTGELPPELVEEFLRSTQNEDK